jgi:hypothetical protein
MRLVAGATAAATPTTAARKSAGRRGRAARGGGKHRKLNRCFLTGTLGAGNLGLLIDDDLFEVFVADIADIFVDGHDLLPLTI